MSAELDLGCVKFAFMGVENEQSFPCIRDPYTLSVWLSLSLVSSQNTCSHMGNSKQGRKYVELIKLLP